MPTNRQKFVSGTTAAISVAAFIMLLPLPAAAYLGPGAGLSAIGAALALVAAIFLAVVGFVWYPAKRLSRRIKGKGTGPDAKPDRDQSSGPGSA